MNEHQSTQSTLTEAIAHGRVAPLSEMPEHHIEDGGVDVRGWEVTTPAFAPVGTVSDLLVDVEAERVRYVAVQLVPDARGQSRCVLLPIGKVIIDDALDRLVVAMPSCLDNLPSHDAGVISREAEERLLADYGETPGGEADFYSCPAFDNSHFQQRGRRSGGVHGRRDEDAEPREEPDATVDPAEAPDPSLRDAKGMELRVTDDD